MIELKEVGGGVYDVYSMKYPYGTLGHRIGEFVRMDDGFYIYEPSSPGSYPAHLLRAIADKLDEMNKDWIDQLDAYFAIDKSD